MIYSNIEINKDKLEEFVRLLLKENYWILSENSQKDIFIRVTEDRDRITVDTVLFKGKMPKFQEKSQFSSEIIEKRVMSDYEKISCEYRDQGEVMAKGSLLRLFNKEKAYKWGALVGVRPTKIVRRFLNRGLSYDKIEKILKDIYHVNDQKVQLLMEIVKREMKYLDRGTVGVYIGVAFCPTKCTYCSFTAYLLKGKYAQRYDEYIMGLYRETKDTGKMTKELGLKINTIYIGGGTPSILSEEEIEGLLLSVKKNYDLEFLEEFTFEAGRIDTLNRKKMEIMKKYGITKISINPQSFNEATLRKVNRYHNKEEFDNIYKIARELGFQINMDLILGLPGETTKDIMYTLEETAKYNPENLTIHCLAIKNASSLNKEDYIHVDTIDYEKIYERINEIALEKGMNPYYMYRQKNSFQWGENIGYSIEGYESIYNMEMIEENKTIIGVGAGAVTKLIWQGENKDNIKRILNPKDPLVWLNELDMRIENKRRIIGKFVLGGNIIKNKNRKNETGN